MIEFNRFQATDDDSDAPPQVQYKWIARDVVATEQEHPYDLEDEQAEVDRTQGNYFRLVFFFFANLIYRINK